MKPIIEVKISVNKEMGCRAKKRIEYEQKLKIKRFLSKKGYKCEFK